MSELQGEQARLLLALAAQQRKDQTSLGARLDAVLARAKAMSNAPASVLERQSPSAEDENPLPRSADGLMYAPGTESPFTHFEWRLRVMIQNFEREVDCFRIRPLFGTAGDETTEDRDARLLEYRRRGLAPREILLLDPAQGGVAAIMKAYGRIDAKD